MFGKRPKIVIIFNLLHNTPAGAVRSVLVQKHSEPPSVSSHAASILEKVLN